MASTAEQSRDRALGPAQLAGMLRRFCSCGVGNRCHCGLPRPASGWTVGRLTELRQLMRLHQNLSDVAGQLCETRSECNRALFALIGRTPAHALAALEAKASRQ